MRIALEILDPGGHCLVAGLWTRISSLLCHGVRLTPIWPPNAHWHWNAVSVMSRENSCSRGVGWQMTLGELGVSCGCLCTAAGVRALMQLIRFSARSSFLSLLVACALEKRSNSKKKTKVAQTTGERGCAICYLGTSAPQTKFPNQLFNFQFSFKEESQVDSAVAEALLEANGVGLVEEATLENDAAVGSVRYAEDVVERCLRCLRCLRRRSVATASRDS